MGDKRGPAARRRIAGLFAHTGESFTLIQASRERPCVGLFVVGSFQTVGAFYDSNEAVGLIRPALSVYVSGAEPQPPLSGDLFFRDGREWTVRKTWIFRVGDTAALNLALCD